MLMTSNDMLLMVRNSSNSSFIEVTIPDNTSGFIGFNGQSIPTLRLAVNSDIDTSAAIGYEKLQNIGGTNKILGRISSGDGSIESLTADNVLTVINTASTTRLDLSRLQGINTNTILGNIGGNGLSAVALTANNVVSIINNATTSITNLPTINNNTLLGNTTYWSKYCTIYPIALFNEYHVLVEQHNIKKIINK